MTLVKSLYFSDRYEMIARLGEGGSGKVWLAKDLHLEQFVAVKCVLKNDVVGAEALEREMVALRRIRHESVPRVLDYGEMEEEFYLVMDLIEGKSLGQLCVVEEMDKENCIGKAGEGVFRAKPFKGRQLMNIALQLSEILTYLHEGCDPPIVHGDIKPSNLILDRRGRIHLIDFGTAGSPGEKCTTGTIGFAAPEQYAAGGGRIDISSDIYSMGATFACLADNRWINLLFRCILSKCMRQDATKRWKSAKVLTKALKWARFINAKKV